MSSESALLWGPAPTAPTAVPGEVHVWREVLDLPADRLAGLSALLSPDEQHRAARFRFERDRNRYVACRGRLRELTAAYSGLDPRELRFTYGDYGKPSLTGSTLAFNVSHAAGIGLIALAPPALLGVDIEQKRDGVEFVEVAKAVFSSREQGVLCDLPVYLQKEAFYKAWTRKEAFIKAVGQGVSYGLDRFDVSLSPGEPPRLRWAADDPAAPDRWMLADLPLGEHFAGAFAVSGSGWRIRLFNGPE